MVKNSGLDILGGKKWAGVLKLRSSLFIHINPKLRRLVVNLLVQDIGNFTYWGENHFKGNVLKNCGRFLYSGFLRKKIRPR